MWISDSALWIRFNSIFWSVTAIALLFVSASKLYGRRTGFVAALLLAVAPPAIIYSDEIRMYAFLSALIVCAWWFQENWIERQTRMNRVLMAISQICVIYSHAIGFIMVASCVLYGGIMILQERNRLKLRHWLETEAIVALLTLPVLPLGFAHRVTHPITPGLPDGLATLTFLGSGVETIQPLYTAFALLITLALVAIAVTTPRLRLPILILILAPLILAAAISLAVKPIWLDRIFTTLPPFIALAFARFAAEGDIGSKVEIPWRAPIAAALAAAWLVVDLSHPGRRANSDGYRDAANYARAHTRPGDEIIIGDSLELWAFLWYFSGPRWGDPLHSYLMMDPWGRVTARLPKGLQTRLSPSVTTFAVRGVAVRLTDPRQPTPDWEGDLVVVGASPRPISGRVLVERLRFQPLIYERWRKASR